MLLWTVVGTTWFLRTYLGLVTPDQVLYHLQNGGLDYADPRMLWRACRCLMAVLVLTALSLCLLSRMKRWHGRLLLALLSYIVYLNLLSLGRAWIADGALPTWIGLWWVHLPALGIALWLLWSDERLPRPRGAAA